MRKLSLLLFTLFAIGCGGGGGGDAPPVVEPPVEPPPAQSDQFIEHAQTGESVVVDTFVFGDAITIDIRSGNKNPGSLIPDDATLSLTFTDTDSGYTYVFDDTRMGDQEDPDTIDVVTIDLSALTPAAYLDRGFIIPGTYGWQFTVSGENDSNINNNIFSAGAIVLEANNS